MSSNYDALAKRYAKEALTTLKPGRFKVTFDKFNRVAVVAIVLPYVKEPTAFQAMFLAISDTHDRLWRSWIHWVGHGVARKPRGPRSWVYVFAAGPSHKELIRNVYEEALKRALAATRA